ncbi:MAG: hypothetical protein CVV44_15665 [Spirochaetae bacterium HGW-Spirochaetae-1]|jgi:anti-anti-sigma factor|nr:MAG: hypothetical protein CVV44_15665 [Spirochaetae bacterium HGW-Spirochaetae-1]
MAKPFSMTYRNKFDYKIFDLTGDIDSNDAVHIEASIKEVNPEINQVILNMEEVGYITGTALNYLMKLNKEMPGNIFIMNANQDLIQIFKSNNAAKFFNFIVNENLLMEKQKKRQLNDLLDIADD